MNRFWKTVLTGTAAGTAVGVYLYRKSKKSRTKLTANNSQAEEIAGNMIKEIMKTTNRFAKDIEKELVRAGRTIQALPNRLNIGGVD
ncbi:MAG: hypothetical protein GX872_05345 [Firmicutes bacterium]|nr:hypothetical protein [Bacillota bacterium]HXL04200.1 hypothetical protein [Bacillota bacterium]